MSGAPARAGWFERVLLPGFAFKAVVIGGGYATGRELAEFFMTIGPRGGVLGMLLAAVIWSLVCAATFRFAQRHRALDYRTFFKALLGRGWPLFELVYLTLIVLILAVFGAAAGALGTSALGVPPLVGTLALAGLIALFAAFGNRAVEGLFKWVSFFLYGVYALFVAVALTRFDDRIGAAFALDVPTDGWALAGLTYAGYNIIGAVVVLPVVRHLATPRDAVVAGLVAGPLAMLPALLFFVCMTAYYPAIGEVALPSDYLLARLGLPAFHALFQLMIFAALLESGTGAVHAINERLAPAFGARGRAFGSGSRLAAALFVLTLAVFVADAVGLVDLIARGYRWLSYALLAVYVVPLLTYGLWQLLVSPAPPDSAPLND